MWYKICEIHFHNANRYVWKAVISWIASRSFACLTQSQYLSPAVSTLPGDQEADLEAAFGGTRSIVWLQCYRSLEHVKTYINELKRPLINERRLSG